jgi:hypothetical protein
MCNEKEIRMQESGIIFSSHVMCWWNVVFHNRKYVLRGEQLICIVSVELGQVWRP